MKDRRSEVRNFILGQISVLVQERSIDPSTNFNFIESGAMESLAFLELVAILETQYSIQFDFLNTDPSVFTSIDGLTNLISEQLNGST